MTEPLPAKERIDILTKRLEALNNSALRMDVEERLQEIQTARLALHSARQDLANGR